MTVRYIQSKLRAVRVVQESAFEADPGSGYKLMRLAHDIVWTPDQTKLMVEPQKSSDMRGPDGNVNGGKGGTITWKCPLNTKTAGALSDLFSSMASTEPPFDYKSNAAKFASITSGTADTIVHADAAQFAIGCPIIHKPTFDCTFSAANNTCTHNTHGLSNGDTVRFYNVGGGLPTELVSGTVYYVVEKDTNTFKMATTSGGSAIDLTGAGTGTHYYCRQGSLRWITSINSTTITVNRAFAQTPATGDSIEAASSWQPKSGPVDTFTIHAFGGQGSTDIFRLVATGCSLTWKLASTGPKALPMIEFSAQVSSWSYSEAALAQAAFAEADPSSVLGGLFYVNEVALATRSIAFDPGLEIAEIESLDTNGRSGWNCSDSKPKVEVSLLHDTDLLDKWGNNTNVPIEFNKFNAYDDCWGFFIPAAEIAKASHEDASGLLNVKPEFVAVDPGSNSDTPAVFYPLWVFGISGV